MKTKGIIGWVAVIIALTNAIALAAPVDHVYVSSNKLDKLNLDGSLDMQFLPGSTDGICRQLAVDGNTGNVWLTCESAISFNNIVYLFDSNGNILHQCSDAPQFCAVVTLQGGMCIDPLGNAWVTNRGLNQVYKYTPSGIRSGPYSVGGTLPSAIACDQIGNLWTANNSSNNISKLSNSGSLIGTFATNLFPRGIATDSDNNIWVVTNGGYVQKFDNSGSLIGNFGSGSLYGNYIAIDQNDFSWIVRTNANLVTKLSSSGANLGNFSVTSPQDVAIDASGNVWTVQRSLGTVTKLSNEGANLGTFPLSGNSGQADSGFLQQKFVLGYNSVEGPNVWVPINGGAPDGAVTLTFDNITAKGNSSYTESSTGTAAPTGFKLGTPPRYYDITSTANYTDNIQVCVGYTETEFTNEASLKLFHNSGTWADVTSSLDTTNNIICGDVTGLSEFAIMEPTGEGPIPTVSQWMLILMAVFLLFLIVGRFKPSRIKA